MAFALHVPCFPFCNVCHWVYSPCLCLSSVFSTFISSFLFRFWGDILSFFVFISLQNLSLYYNWARSAFARSQQPLYSSQFLFVAAVSGRYNAIPNLCAKVMLAFRKTSFDPSDQSFFSKQKYLFLMRMLFNIEPWDDVKNNLGSRSIMFDAHDGERAHEYWP